MANLLSSLLLGGLALFAGSSTPATPIASSNAGEAVVAVTDGPADAPSVEMPAPPTDTPIAEPVVPTETAMRAAAVNVLTEVGMVYVPRTFHPRADGTFDLVIHFHGTPGAVEGALDRAGIDAVLVVVNLGLGSGPYETRYQHEQALDAVVMVAERTLMRSHVMAAPHVGRIALSSWSAGYGAIWRLLMRDKVPARVDAVLLADGMHGAFKPVGYRAVEDAHMAPFLRFATLAASGERLMAITHSGIETYKYASTTETAHYLERAVDAAPVVMAEVGPRGMKKTSHAEKGGLSVDGYAGNTPEAHCDHLLALADTTFGALARRWGPLQARGHDGVLAAQEITSPHRLCNEGSHFEQESAEPDVAWLERTEQSLSCGASLCVRPTSPDFGPHRSRVGARTHPLRSLRSEHEPPLPPFARDGPFTRHLQGERARL